MAADVFGDSSLFSEFEKDRETERFLDNCDVEGQVQESEDVNQDEEMEDNGGNSSESDNEDENSAQENTKLKVEAPEANNSLSAENISQHKLMFERNKYLSFAKIIDTTRYVPEDVPPAIQILYQNSNFSRKHRAEIELFIQHLMDRDFQEEHQNGPIHLPKLNLKASTPTAVDINSKLPSSKRTAEMWDAHAIIGNAQFHESFMVDSRGWPITPNCQQQELIMDMILFEKLFEVPLPVDDVDLALLKKDKRKRAACFNCDGEHNLSECPEPKDFNKIGANRRKFLDSKVNSVPKLSLSKNYSDFEENPRFKKFKPGQISGELYSAMGISPSQLPLYIYKMRVLGYPPGWLVQAKKGYSSGIVIFDKEGRETNLKGETLEDGELNADKEKEEDVEVEKIIEYPGFTVPPPDHVYDECERLNMPPLQPHQLKQTLEQHVSVKEEFKKRKAEEEAEIEKKRIRIINKEADMELSDEEETSGNDDSDFRPPLPVDTPPGKPPIPMGTPPITPANGSKKNLYHPTLANLTPPHFGAGGPPIPDYTPPTRPPLPDGTPPPTPPILNQHEISTESARSESPTFETLQNKYEDIMKQLNEDSSSQSDSDVKIIETPDEDSDASLIFVPELEKQESNVSEVSMTDVSVRTLSRASSTLSIQSLDDSTLSRGSSKVKVYGTPILESSTLETALPASDKFKVGTEDHLLFENLPGATGTFSKMRRLLDKIKTKIKK